MFCGVAIIKEASLGTGKERRRKHVPNSSCLSTEISHSPSFLRDPHSGEGVRRLLNLAGRQKLLPNSICLSTRPLILRPWKKSSHFRRFSEPVSKFRRPNANRSRLRFLLVLLPFVRRVSRPPPPFLPSSRAPALLPALTKSSFLLSTTLLRQEDTAKRSSESAHTQSLETVFLLLE